MDSTAPHAEEAEDQVMSSTCAVISVRTAPPKDIIFKCEFVQILFAKLFVMSDPFESGGFKWRLKVYPHGRTIRGISTNGYTSVYLKLAEDDQLLPCGWELNFTFRIFLYDQIRDQYFTMEGGPHVITRLHATKRECGFIRFIPIEAILDVNNGFALSDSVTFGAEVFILSKTNTNLPRIHNQGLMAEVVSRVQLPDSKLSYAGMIEHLFINKYYPFAYSHDFQAANSHWKLKIENNGMSDRIVMCLQLMTPSRDTFMRTLLNWIMRKDRVESLDTTCMYVHCTVKILNQLCTQHSKAYSVSHVFSYESTPWYLSDFLTLNDLKDDNQGFLVNGRLAFEIKFEDILIHTSCL